MTNTIHEEHLHIGPLDELTEADVVNVVDFIGNADSLGKIHPYKFHDTIDPYNITVKQLRNLTSKEAAELITHFAEKGEVGMITAFLFDLEKFNEDVAIDLFRETVANS